MLSSVEKMRPQLLIIKANRKGLLDLNKIQNPTILRLLEGGKK